MIFQLVSFRFQRRTWRAARQGTRVVSPPWLSPEVGRTAQERRCCPPTRGVGTASTHSSPPISWLRAWKKVDFAPLHGVTNNPGAAGATAVAQFQKELAAVQQTSGTLCLRNRNLGDRGLQDASPALQENELATVSKKPQQNAPALGTWDASPRCGCPEPARATRGTPLPRAQGPAPLSAGEKQTQNRENCEKA